jgi:organic hydroperoxide reductase OsmC/OhrA
MRKHRYTTHTEWTGNLGTGTSAYKAYSRDHVTSGAGKSAVIDCSSDPAFRGDPARYNPEELLVAAIANCHMLWVLHLCADAGIVITAYHDDPEGEMVEHPDGSGEFTRVVLHPRMMLADPSRTEEAIAIHDRVHHLCCLARSVNFPVEVEPFKLDDGR